ncbi:MAG TPA: hypothetical protein VHY32_04345 [Caulobacteraceae bacterium]|jgi:hypothetical protein|nr:hypothetical protein [Caulobacteraceae bacterium]
MKRIQILNRASTLAIIMVGAGLSLAGCNKTAAPTDTAQQAPAPTAAMALADDPTAPPLAAAPNATALPPAPPLRVAHLQNGRDNYAFVDGGYAMSNAFADAPPDYTFDYDGVRPWVWQADNGDYQVVEPVSGGDRYYYYHQGSDAPFLVRDTDYSYGFDNGQLAVVYDRSGRALPDSYAEQRAEWAARDFARARAIRAAAQQDQHQAVVAAHWRERQNEIDAERQAWADEQSQDDDWRAYHADHDQYYETQWDAERYRRQSEAARYAQRSNDTQAAARFAAAAAIALQASQGHREGPGPQPQQQFGQARPGPAPGTAFSQAAPAPGQPGLTPRGPNEFGPGHERSMGPQAPGQLAGNPQAAQQAAAERQRSMQAAAQAQNAQAAAQQRAQAEGAMRQQQQAQAAQAAAERQRTAQAAGQAREAQQAQQAAARQQHEAQAAQATAERQRAAQAASQAREAQQAQQAAARQQHEAQAAQATAERQRAAQAAGQAREAQQAATRRQQQAEATQAASARQKAVDAAAQSRVAQQAAAHQQAEAHAAQAHEGRKGKPGEGKPEPDHQKPPQ